MHQVNAEYITYDNSYENSEVGFEILSKIQPKNILYVFWHLHMFLTYDTILKQ